MRWDHLLHGLQEGRHFRADYNSYCYLPLYARVGDIPLWSQLRTSDQDVAAGAVEALEQIVAAIRRRCRRARRVIGKAEVVAAGDNPRFIVDQPAHQRAPGLRADEQRLCLGGFISVTANSWPGADRPVERRFTLLSWNRGCMKPRGAGRALFAESKNIITPPSVRLLPGSQRCPANELPTPGNRPRKSSAKTPPPNELVKYPG